MSALVESVASNEFRLIIGDEGDEAFVAAKAMIDLIADVQLERKDEEVAHRTVRAALVKHPEIRSDVKRYLDVCGVAVDW